LNFVLPGKDEVVSSYEELRRLALSGTGGGHGWGLLIGRGMTAWLRALAHCHCTPSRSIGAPKALPRSVEERPPLGAEITQVLANMVFSVVGAKT